MESDEPETDESDYSDYSVCSDSDNEPAISNGKSSHFPSSSATNSYSNFQQTSTSKTNQSFSTNSLFKTEANHSDFGSESDSWSSNSSINASSSGSFSSASDISDYSDVDGHSCSDHQKADLSRFCSFGADNIKIEPLQTTNSNNAEMADASIMDLYNKLFNNTAPKAEQEILPIINIKQEKRKSIKIKEEIECFVCNQSFFSHVEFRDHMKMKHQIAKPYQCTKCDKKYVNPGSLKDHELRDHQGIRNYECTICHKKFYEKYSFKEHMEMHTRRIAKKCVLCDAVFVYEAKWYDAKYFFVFFVFLSTQLNNLK